LCRLEPISYDGGYVENTSINDQDCFGRLGDVENKVKNGEDVIRYWPLRDSVYMKEFYDYVSKISSKQFIDTQFDSIQTQLDHDEVLLNKEFPYYHYSNEHIYKKASEFRSYLPELSNMITNPEYYEVAQKIQYQPLQLSRNFNDRLITYMIHIFSGVDEKGNRTLEVENFFGDTIRIVSGKLNEDIFYLDFDAPFVVAPVSEPFMAHQFIVDKDYDEVFVEIPSADQRILLPVIPWPAPKASSSRQNVEQEVSFPQLNYYSLRNRQVIFNGEVHINTNVIVPAGYELVFEKGTTVDITDSATFVSYSPVFIKGTIDNPVLVGSSDRSAKGFNVFQASKKSLLRHVRFDGLSNLKFEGWMTTCAVCFYESDVEMHQVEFSRNVGCDDALNVVRSHFEVDSCRFIDTFADAFDSDFCTGTLSNSYFNRPGNDAIDFSGSQIHIDGCTIIDAGDKGVSGGEKSELYVSNTIITGGNIGIASKDKSNVVVQKCEITGNVYALAAYQKKPEYGSATIVVDDVEFRKNMFLHIIEEHSKLIFNQKEIKGTARKVAERFY
jgi:hypothetical protein